MFDGTLRREPRRGGFWVVFLVVLGNVMTLLGYFGDWRWVVPIVRLEAERELPVYWGDEHREARYPYRERTATGCVIDGRLSQY
jgi:hypothetical protein